MFDYFSAETPWEIREQILRHNATQNMSDVERARFFKLPEGCRMREGAKIIWPENLKIGKYCWIGENAILDASGHLEIGDHTSIGLCVFIWTHDSHKLNTDGTNTREYSYKIKRKSTKIGSNCFISGPSVVMPGVSIGNKCIITPMSVVYEDLPDNTLYMPYKNFCDELDASKKMQNIVKSLRKQVAGIQKRLSQFEDFKVS